MKNKKQLTAEQKFWTRFVIVVGYTTVVVLTTLIMVKIMSVN
jgi:uncharacterized protein (DUF983 family)|tara:strand:- start:4976 stop:5101 length:126 start_codon:yes stop_codon:yes gene_type:complete